MTRKHNEWFRPVSLNNRKSCPTCKAKLTEEESIWSWIEYRYAKARLVKHFCRQCFLSEVQAPLLDHASTCGCEINLITMWAIQPEWLTLQCPVLPQLAGKTLAVPAFDSLDISLFEELRKSYDASRTQN